MRIRKHLGLLLIIGCAVTVTTALAALQRFDQQEPRRNAGQQILDKSSWPLTDYIVPPATDPKKAAKRRLRGKKYDKSEFQVYPADPSENTTLVDAVDTTLPTFPVEQSSVVLVGSVDTSQAFLSDDQTGVYSEFNLTVEAVLKADSLSLVGGSSVEVARQGGRVKFPSGRVHWYSVDKENMPKPGRRYVFFLCRQNEDEALHILTAYELRDGKVFPLDELPQFMSQHGRSETAFMNDSRSALSLNSAKLFSQRRFRRPV